MMPDFGDFLMIFKRNTLILGQHRYGVGGKGMGVWWVMVTAKTKKWNYINGGVRVAMTHDNHMNPQWCSA